MFEADSWKMDYGGHDSEFSHNLVYHGAGDDHDGNDGQNCINTWWVTGWPSAAYA